MLGSGVQVYGRKRFVFFILKRLHGISFYSFKTGMEPGDMKGTFLSIIFLYGCYTSSGMEHAGADAGRQDNDSHPVEFCSGEARAEFEGILIEPVSVTTYEPVMDCCWSVAALFHTAPVLGFNITLRIIFSVDVELPPLSLDLESLPEGIRVRIYHDREDDIQGQRIKGMIEMSGYAHDGPIMLSICAEEVHETSGRTGYIKLFAANVPWVRVNWGDRFGLWLLSDPNVSADDAAGIPIESLSLDERPLFDLNGVLYYDAVAHAFQLSPVWSPHFPSALPDVGFYGLPFVIAADEERIYLGAFMTSVSSYVFDHPVIIVDNIQDQRVAIEPGYPAVSETGTDPRNDPRILEVFEQAGRLVR